MSPLLQLSVIPIIILVGCNVPIGRADTVDIFPTKSLSIAEGAGFLAFLNPNGETTVKKAFVTEGHWIHCSVSVNNVQYSLDSDQIHRIGDKTTVERYDAEKCGVRVKNLQKALETKWTLYGTDQSGADSTGILDVTVTSIKFIDELNVTVSGSSSTATVNCPDKDGSRYCRIIDADQVVSESCTKTVDLTQQVSHFWCHTMFWGAMTERITKINLFVEENDRDIKATVEETEDHLVLSCQYRSMVSLCRALSNFQRDLFAGNQETTRSGGCWRVAHLSAAKSNRLHGVRV